MAINFLLKRSSTASKRPTAANLAIGELGLNYDSNTPGLFFEDSAGNVRKVGPAEVSATAPNSVPAGSSGNSVGEFWFDTGPSNLKIWTGASFVESRASVATLTTTRTLWGQNFDGSANVTGSLTSVGDITGTAAVTLSSAAASALNLNSGTTGAVTLDSGTTGAVNIGNNSNAKTITLGNTTGATTINVNSGTGGILTTSPHFTMADRGEVRFREAVANGTNYIGLEAPASVGSDLVFVLPGSDGSTTTGYTLKTNGSAALSFGTANIVTSDTAPASPLDGDLWYNSSNGRLFVYYEDTNSSQWVDAAPNDSASTIRQLDSIASQFNGSTTAFTLKIGGANYTPQSTYQLLIAIGGVVQTPGTAYTLSGATITFTSAPPSGATFSGIVLAEAVLSVGGSNTQVQYNNNGLIAGSANFTFDSATGGITLTSTDAGATVQPLITLYRDSASPAASDIIGGILFQGEDSAGNAQSYAQIAGIITDATSTSEDGAIGFYTVAAGGSLTEKVRIESTGNVVPRVDNSYNLGSASLRWANVYTGDLHLKNDRGDWTMIEEEDALTLRNNKTGKIYNIMMTERNA